MANRWTIGRGADQGALTSVYAATSSDPEASHVGGAYFDSARVHAQAPRARSKHLAERLWRASEHHLAAGDFPVPNPLSKAA